jgi:hypothetical protein
MSVDNVRPEANPLFAFTLMIVSAFADGGCDHFGLLLNLRGAHYRSRWAMRSRWRRAVKIHGLRLANAIAQFHSPPTPEL